MLKEQRLKREYSGRVWGGEIKEYSFKSSKRNFHSKEEMGRKGKSSWSGGSEQVRRDLSHGARALKMRQTTAEHYVFIGF